MSLDTLKALYKEPTRVKIEGFEASADGKSFTLSVQGPDGKYHSGLRPTERLQSDLIDWVKEYGDGKMFSITRLHLEMQQDVKGFWKWVIVW